MRIVPEKHYRSLLQAAFALLFLLCGTTASALPLHEQDVNPVIGNISYYAKYHRYPDATVSEDVRIRTHLEFVENILRRRDISALPKELKERRAHLLDLLHAYRMAGVFPRNYDYPQQRIPCFIDADGRICAVGYLVEQTAGREVAEALNEKFKYWNLMDMHDPVLEKWIAASGLTRKECAMIQPTYTPAAAPDQVTAGNGIGSATLGGINTSLMVMNSIQIGKGSKDLTVPIIGLVTGAGQIVLGSVLYPGTIYDGWTGQTLMNKSEQTLSLVNIGMGTATMVLSAWNLFGDMKKQPKYTSWSIYSYPAGKNDTGIGFYVSQQF